MCSFVPGIISLKIYFFFRFSGLDPLARCESESILKQFFRLWYGIIPPQDLYLNVTQHTQKKQRQALKPQEGFEPAIPVPDRSILLLRWFYSPMRTSASLMDFSQSTLLFKSGWLFRGHILSFLTVDLFLGGVVSPTPNPQPGGPGLYIYIPWRLGGPVIPPATEYPF
jgi:hypothetical protein